MLFLISIQPYTITGNIILDWILSSIIVVLAWFIGMWLYNKGFKKNRHEW